MVAGVMVEAKGLIIVYQPEAVLGSTVARWCLVLMGQSL